MANSYVNVDEVLEELMKTGRLPWTFASLFSAGAVTMYFVDPNRGKRRRAVLKDAIVHSGYNFQRFARRFRRDFEHRVEGAVAETHHLFDQEQVSDAVLEQRIRTALGRAVSHPGAIEVNCTEGSAFLGGWILADEIADVNSAATSVRGVRKLSTFLNTTDHPEHISALQAGRRRRHLPEFLRESWSPTARVLAGCVGAGLMLYGAIHRKSIGKAAGVNGAILLARSVLNAPLKRMVGADQTVGLHIQKTISINATPSELYEFWKNPENYPKVFAHVNQVTSEKDGLFRWQVPGPAGVPLTWTGRITRQIPDKTIEWWSTPGSTIENHGVIHLEAEKDGRTRVHIEMSYSPPAGLLGHAVAALLGLDPKNAMDQDFVRLKSLFELGKTRAHGHRVVKTELKSAGLSAEQVA
jgi:uncharacterized membrane protein